MAKFNAGVVGVAEAKARLRAFDRGVANPRPLLVAAGMKMQEQAVRTFRMARDPVTGAPWKAHAPATFSTGRILQRSGRLLKSIVARRPAISGRTVAIGTNAAYGPIHQSGGTITAKGGKYLAVPVTDEARRVKSAHPARAWIAKQGGLKTKDNPGGRAVFMWGSSGPWGIGKVGRGKKAEPTAHFVLKTSVKIPRRRFLGLDAAMKSELEKIVAFALARLLSKSAVGGTGG